MNENDNIFATGAFLKPEKIIINGAEQWRWIAVGFEDTNYYCGEEIEVYEYANKFKNLFIHE